MLIDGYNFYSSFASCRLSSRYLNISRLIRMKLYRHVSVHNRTSIWNFQKITLEIYSIFHPSSFHIHTNKICKNYLTYKGNTLADGRTVTQTRLFNPHQTQFRVVYNTCVTKTQWHSENQCISESDLWDIKSKILNTTKYSYLAPIKFNFLN